jgi:L-alanine-DL-glutamate epimerase-like enolase superfamily enzyme
MKITGVKTFVVDGGPRAWTFVKVETDEGIVGWGDCTEWEVYGPVVAMVEHLAPRVIGRDPMQAELLWAEMTAYNIRHNGGIAWKAMAGIDSALWDIRGKALNAPVWQLLGGKVRDELRLYWSHCGTFRARSADKIKKPPVKRLKDLATLSEEVLAKGFTAIKTNIFPLEDLPSPGRLTSSKVGIDISVDQIKCATSIVGTFRKALGPDVGIALDTGLNYRLGSAIKLARAMEPFDLMWYETETFDPGSLKTVRESTRTTICTGESLYGLEGYRPFLELYAQDIVMPDFAWNGVTMGRKICDLALAYDTLVAPHNCHSPMNTLVSANIVAGCTNLFILEFDEDDPPWRNDLMTHPFEVKKGYLKVPDRPGLGSDLNERMLKKYALNE